MNLHPGRNVYLTSWFILSVLFLTGGKTSVVLHMSRIPHDMDVNPGRNVYLTAGSFCLCCFSQMMSVCGPYMCPGSPITRTSTLVGRST